MTDLPELVPDSAILLDVDAADSDALIKSMATTLADVGLVEPDYADRCIARESDHPTGLVTAAGSIALPHADLREGEKAGIAVARPLSPVEFGAMADEGTVPAAIVFMLAVTGGEGHLNALAEIIEVVQDPERMGALLTATTPDDVKSTLRRAQK